MDIGYITDYGNVRSENQDRFLILLKRYNGEEAILCAVADGMGGTGNGSLASDLTVRRLRQWWESDLPELLQQKAAHAYVSQSLDKLIVECNKEIDRQAKLNQISTGTTLSLLFAYKNQAVMKHIGDSRIYLERNAEWSQVTRDHTWEQQEISQGRDPKKDPAYNKKRGALVNALGAGITCYIDTQMMQMACGDRYLLCSDGFYHYVEPETDIKTVGESAQQIMEHMAEKIRKTPATDNFTAVLIINGVAKPETFAVNTVCL